MEEQGKTRFLLPLSSKKIFLSTLIFHLGCDTCDSKKTTSLLEGARYAYAREHSALSFHLIFGFAWVIALLSLYFWLILLGRGSKTRFF